MRVWLILTVAQLATANLFAQTQTTRVDTIAEARRLRDANDFAGAATLMRAYVEAHPDGFGVRWRWAATASGGIVTRSSRSRVNARQFARSSSFTRATIRR